MEVEQKQTSPLYLVRLAILQLEEKLLLELVHEFKHCTVFGLTSWQHFREARGKDLVNLIERDYAYVKVELEDHLAKLETVDPTLVGNSYTIFSSALPACLKYTTEILKEYFVRESRAIQAAHRTELVTLLYVAQACKLTGDLAYWLKEYQLVESFDYEAETMKVPALIHKIMEFAKELGAEVEVVLLRDCSSESE